MTQAQSTTVEPQAAECETLPEGGKRTAASLLLFIHLFALGVAILSNMHPLSPVRQKLRDLRVLTDYLQLFDMDQSYDWPWTLGMTTDVDHQLEVQLTTDNGPVEVVYPGAFTGMRADRYRRLAQHIAELADAENTAAGLLPRQIGLRVLAEHEATRATLRVRGNLLRQTEDVKTGVVPTGEEFWRTALGADVAIVDGELVYSQHADAVELAPPPVNPRKE